MHSQRQVGASSAEAETERIFDSGPGLLQGLGNAQRGEGEPQQREGDHADAHSNEHQAADVLGDGVAVGWRRRDEVELCRAHRVDGAPEGVVQIFQRSFRDLSENYQRYLKRSVREVSSNVVSSTAIKAEGSTVSH